MMCARGRAVNSMSPIGTTAVSAVMPTTIQSKVAFSWCVRRAAIAKRHDRPGPYDNAADAIDGLKSPNLATQYLARERLLADGESSVPAVARVAHECGSRHPRLERCGCLIG